MKKIIIILTLLLSSVALSHNAFAGCNSTNTQAMTISDFEYMSKSETTGYLCGSINGPDNYHKLASRMKELNFHKIAADVTNGAYTCQLEIKRANMVLAKKHGLTKAQLSEMKDIMRGPKTGDNRHRCIAAAN